MTFLEIRTYVLDRLGIVATDTPRVTQINGVVNSEYERLAAITKATLTVAAVTFTVASQAVTLPTVLSIEGLRGSNNNILKPIPIREMLRYEATYLTTDLPSQPAFYALLSPAAARIWPAQLTTNDTTAQLAYVAVPTPLTADGNVPSALPTWMHNLIGEAAVYRMAMTEENWEQADRSRAFLLNTIPDAQTWAGSRAGGKLPMGGLDNDVAAAFPPPPRGASQ